MLNIRYRGRLLYSERGPARLAERMAEACDTTEGPARLYLLASPGLWYGVARLLARIDQASALLCVEVDPELAAISRRTLPPELASDPRLFFYVGLDSERLLTAAQALGHFRRCLGVRLSGGSSFHEEAYRSAAEMLDQHFTARWKNKATLMGLGRLWVRNIFHNLAAIEEIAPLPFSRIDRPAVVCGAGPSLENILPFARENRGGLFLIACDTALPTLLGAGLVPDLLVCLEAQAHNLPDFVPLGRRPCPLVADLSSHPATFRAVQGPKYLTRVAIEEGAFLRRLATLGFPMLSMPPLGSVGVHAVHLARQVTRKPIFLSGLDFAFSPGKTHARGAPSLEAEERSMNRLKRWPRQTSVAFRARTTRSPGGQSLTDPVLSGYAALLAEELRLPGAPVFDLRGGGLPLGAPTLSFREAEALLRANATEVDDPNLSAKPPEGQSTNWGAAARAFLRSEYEALTALEALLKGKGAREELPARLEQLDYLSWPLPDAERTKALPQDLLNRILVETEYWIWHLGEIIEGAEERGSSKN